LFSSAAESYCGELLTGVAGLTGLAGDPPKPEPLPDPNPDSLLEPTPDPLLEPEPLPTLNPPLVLPFTPVYLLLGRTPS
jgi:hypothetical protein